MRTGSNKQAHLVASLTVASIVGLVVLVLIAPIAGAGLLLVLLAGWFYWAFYDFVKERQ